MYKWFLVSCCLLIAISYTSYYLFFSNSWIEQVKTLTYASFYRLKLENEKLKLERLQTEARIAGKPLIPPFIDFDREYAIAPKYNLSICRIKKCMSTLMSGVACVLYDTEKFIRNNRSILEVWSQSEAQKFPKRKQCYNCQGNVTCFLENQYKRFVQHASGHSRLRASYEDRHAAPLSWFVNILFFFKNNIPNTRNCEFNKHMNEYKLVKLKVDPQERKGGLENLMNVLKESKVPNSTLQYLENNALSGETLHATFDSDAHDVLKKQIESDVSIREWLRRIYYLDFVIFDFDTTFIES
uniref:Uncharacterized protein n=1 Tax=Caenorhabditis japonica TaxID=281687 RepID=A0A8R1E4Z9_CAEJA